MPKPPIVSLNVFPPVAMKKCELNKNNIRFLFVSFFLFLSLFRCVWCMDKRDVDWVWSGFSASFQVSISNIRWILAWKYECSNKNQSVWIHCMCNAIAYLLWQKKNLRHNSTCNRTAEAVTSKKKQQPTCCWQKCLFFLLLLKFQLIYQSCFAWCVFVQSLYRMRRLAYEKHSSCHVWATERVCCVCLLCMASEFYCLLLRHIFAKGNLSLIKDGKGQQKKKSVSMAHNAHFNRQKSGFRFVDIYNEEPDMLLLLVNLFISLHFYCDLISLSLLQIEFN